MIYAFRVVEFADTYFEGNIEVEAESKEQAVEKLNQMKTEDVIDLVENWEEADNTSGTGHIEIYNDEELILEKD